MQIGLGDKVRLRNRCIYDSILSRASWDSPVKITQGAITEIM